MRRKNLLFIIPEMAMGGAQRSLSRISDELSVHHNIWVVVFNKHFSTLPGHVTSVLSLDVETGTSLVRKVLAFIQRVFRLRKLKKQLSIDVAISFLEGADYVNILSGRGEKIILSIRGSKLHDENMLRSNFALRKFLISKLYRFADGIVCVSNGIAQELIHDFKINRVPVHVINNFYEVDLIDAQAREPLPKSVEELFEFPTIVMSGRLAVEKGNIFILRVFAVLKNANPELRLVFVGDGPLRQELIQQADMLNLRVAYKEINDALPDVFITGSEANVFKYLHRARIYVLNSSSEGFPNGLVEAMACSVPVISADCPYGPGEILRREPKQDLLLNEEFADFGVLLPILSEQANSENIYNNWVDVLSQFLVSAELRERYSKLGRHRAEMYSKSNAILKWRSLIES